MLLTVQSKLLTFVHMKTRNIVTVQKVRARRAERESGGEERRKRKGKRKEATTSAPFECDNNYVYVAGLSILLLSISSLCPIFTSVSLPSERIALFSYFSSAVKNTHRAISLSLSFFSLVVLALNLSLLSIAKAQGKYCCNLFQCKFNSAQLSLLL